jgi:hypothetical protein
LVEKYSRSWPLRFDCYLKQYVNDLTEKDESGQISEGATAYTRATWFSAIKDCDDGFIHYRQNVEIAGAEPEYPDFSSYMSVGNADYKSPVPSRNYCP